MYCKTWAQGTNVELDSLFETLRIKQFNDHSHPLWANYNEHPFTEASALSIAFDDNDSPEFCSSIQTRTCWPPQAYRILTRLWKITPTDGPLRGLQPLGGIMLHSQIDWLKANTDCKLIFISREGNSWQKFVIDQYKNKFDLEFKFDSHSYKTCETPKDDSCWQPIIYQGDETLLTEWERR